MTKQLPTEFLLQMSALIGEHQSKELSEALCSAPSISIRRNESKPCALPAWADDAEKVDWCNNGLYLSERPNFTFTPQLHAGGYYVQDASSMIYEYIIEKIAPKHAIKYLDMCAAPGGKTTSAINKLPIGSLVVANEYVRQRANILKENLQKWGTPNVIVTNSASEELGKISDFFDIVAVDAPCSGEGMMRKDDDAVAQWSPALIRDCAKLQWQILYNIWDSLREDGILIYSTCTFNREENELMVERICSELGGVSIDLEIPAEWKISPGIDTPHHCYRFMPHLTRGEGLFVSVIRKTSISQHNRHYKSKRDNRPDKIPNIDWIDRDKFHLFFHRDIICAIERNHLESFETIDRYTKVIQAGLEVATIKGKDLIPEHALALSTALCKDKFPCVEIDDTTAIKYLRRESITLPPDTPRGYILIVSHGLPLGFVKNIGNRSNNLYPQEWRIRTSLK